MVKLIDFEEAEDTLREHIGMIKRRRKGRRGGDVSRDRDKELGGEIARLKEEES